MIRPTLFVGLGTTGTNILKYLRRLMFEEYGRAGLPVFRYVSIETDGTEDGEDPGLRVTSKMESYEQIRVVKATIASTVPIEHKLRPRDPMYDANLTQWLDADLLKIGDRSFVAGAKNIRMAGRLCLWESWTDVERTLKAEANAVNAAANVSAAQAFLRKHLERKGSATNDRHIDPNVTDVYVFGSLCGGSCSGMWLDIAYFFRSLFSAAGDGVAAPKLYGIFTMYDNEQATELRNKVRAANCYGALYEYNFYNHIDTTYSMTFPSGFQVSNVKDAPFDYTLFVSRSGKNPAVRFNKPDGSFDETGLNQMVALNLFADVSGDSDGKKDAIRTDWYGHDGYRQLKEVEEGDTATKVRCMASFGLTAVWYPKYRIATGAACLIGQRLSQQWVKPHNEAVTVRKKGRAACDSLVDKHLEKLTSPPEETPLRHVVDTLLSKARGQFGRITETRELEKKIKSFPSNAEPFGDKFDRGREFYALIDQQVPICRQFLVDELWALYREQLNQLDFGRDFGLGDIETYFLALDGAIEELMKACPTSLPRLDLDQLDFSPMRRAEQNKRLWLVGLQEKSIDQHRGQIIKKYVDLVDKTYVDLRNYFLRPILEELREILGFGLQAEKEHEFEERKTIKTSIDAIKKNLKDLENQLEGDYREAADVPQQINVTIVANNKDNDLEEDMKRLAYKIDAADARGDLLGDRSLAELFEKEPENINVQIKEVYRRYSLAQIDGFQVVTKSLDMIGKSRSNRIEAVARRSTPCQTFNHLYQPLHPPTPPTMISGHDPTGNSLNELQVALSQEGHEFARTSSISIDHLLFFYNEEAGFAIDDLESHNMLYTRFRDKPGPYGHLTRQDTVFFDIDFSVRKKRLERWLEPLIVLVPAIRRYKPDAFEGFLRKGPLQEVRYVYAFGGGMEGELHLQDDEVGIEQISRREKIAAYQWFVYHLHHSLEALGRGFVQDVINEMAEALPRKERHLAKERFEGFLREVYAPIWGENPDYEDPGVPHQRKPIAEEAAPPESGPTPSDNLGRSTPVDQPSRGRSQPPPESKQSNPEPTMANDEPAARQHEQGQVTDPPPERGETETIKLDEMEEDDDASFDNDDSLPEVIEPVPPGNPVREDPVGEARRSAESEEPVDKPAKPSGDSSLFAKLSAKRKKPSLLPESKSAEEN